MSKSSYSTGSALLLAVMVISVLTTTTLGAIAIRFDQLLATDRITNSAKAKLAADSGIIKLREKLAASQTSFNPEAFDLTSQQAINIPAQGRFRPNPRHTVYTLESQVINLPRCLAVAVISPWVNSGNYVFDNDDSASNPAMVFYYANIINDTPLGAVGSATNNLGGYSAVEKERSLSELTKMGQFYNPYAPSGYTESSRNYWTVKLGGPQDEFLYKKNPTGTGSFYRGLDFVYIPYLPRFTDSGVLKVANQPESGLTRKDASTIRNDFENVIKENNFKVWLDGSVTNDLLYQYGLADLFTETGEEQSRITWLQPTLWNDLPEADTEPGFANGLSGPYVNNNITTSVDTTMQWQRQSTPTKVLAAADSGWTTEIVRGAKSFSFVFPSGDLNRTITPGTTLSLNLFGSLEGLRLNQPITVTALTKHSYKPIPLRDRDSTTNGRFYQAKITRLTKLGNGEISVDLNFYNGTYQTPVGIAGNPIKLAEISTLSLQAGPQVATERSLSNVSLQTNGRQVTTSASSCSYSSLSFVICPAVGDIVNLTKSGSEPAWGKVTNVTFDTGGTNLTSFELDKFREYPLPLKDLASAVVSDGGVEKIAYYGGSVTATEYDGSVNSITDGLWLYNPAEANQNNAWTYVTNTPVGGDTTNLPGPRSGASLASVGNNLYLFGGFTYTGMGEVTTGGAQPCADNYYLLTCLGMNLPNTRVAKTYPNTMFKLDLTTKQWSKVAYDSVNTSQPTIVNGAWLELKTVSMFGERSGKDGWQSKVVVNTNSGANPISLALDPTVTNTLNLTTSHAGFSVGDEVYLSGTKAIDSTSFLMWGRVTGLPSANSIRIKTYGMKDGTGTVSLRSLNITALKRVKGSAKCIWQDLTKNCQIDARIDGIGIGDAVVLESYDSYTTPTQLTNTYSGYVSSINGNVVSFVSGESLAGFDDYRSGTTPTGQSVRLLPIGRSGGKLSANGTKLYYWQGDQTNQSSNARTADIWEFDTATNRWQVVPLALGTLPNTQLTIQTVKMPGSATVFTSTSTLNNQEIKKDKVINWEINGNSYSDTVWDDAKTWNLELSDESGNSFWNLERITEGSTIIVERLAGTVRERFTGIVVSINTSEQAKIVVRHHPNHSGDSGLQTHSANAKVTITYPNYINNAAVSADNATRVSIDNIQVDNATTAVEMRKIPVGAVVMAYSGSLSGVNTTLVTATIDSRGMTGSNRVNFTAAGAAYLTTPLPQTQSANVLAGSGADDRVAMNVQTYRPKNTEGGLEWANNITGVTNAKKWVARFPTGYTFNGSNRPGPRSGGMLVAAPDKRSIFIAGGSYGPFASVWRQQNTQLFVNLSWSLAKSNVSATQDLPNMYGASGEVLSTGKMVVFGGQRRFTNTTLGPKIMGQSNSNTGVDGSYSMVDSGASTITKSAQFVRQLSDQYSGVADQSLEFTSNATASNFTNVCQFVGQENCDYQLIRHLGTLGRYNGSWGSSLAVINPGDGFKTESGARSLILSGPTQSLDRSNGRWDQEGYTPYRCDVGGADCNNFSFGSLSTPESNHSKTTLFAGYSRITGGGSILVTPVGIGRAITTGSTGNSYCARESVNTDYSCKNTSLPGRYMKWIPDSEDVLFLFNAAKALSATDAYRVVGYYGGVVRGYLAVSIGSDLNIQEIAP